MTIPGGLDLYGIPNGRMRMLLEVENANSVRIECGSKGRIAQIHNLEQRTKVLLDVISKEHRKGFAKASWRSRRGSSLFVLDMPNGVVNTGIDNLANRWSGIALTGANAAPGFIGVSNSSSAVTAATVFINGAGAGAAANTIIKAFSPVIAYARPALTAGATFVNADFTAGVFVINKVGWLSTSTDAGTGLINVIGGTGGADPYSRTFVVDFTNAGSFTLIPQIAMSIITVKGAFPSPL